MKDLGSSFSQLPTTQDSLLEDIAFGPMFNAQQTILALNFGDLVNTPRFTPPWGAGGFALPENRMASREIGHLHKRARRETGEPIDN